MQISSYNIGENLQSPRWRAGQHHQFTRQLGNHGIQHHGSSFCPLSTSHKVQLSPTWQKGDGSLDHLLCQYYRIDLIYNKTIGLSLPMWKNIYRPIYKYIYFFQVKASIAPETNKCQGEELRKVSRFFVGYFHPDSDSINSVESEKNEV